jgi:hypothetical protein
METGKGKYLPGPEGDEILREVWATKDALSASYGHDPKRLFEITREHEELSRRSGRRFVSLLDTKK